MLVMAYYMAKRQCTYQELGGDYFDRRNADTMRHRLVKKLKNLGYEVTLTPITAPPTAQEPTGQGAHVNIDCNKVPPRRKVTPRRGENLFVLPRPLKAISREGARRSSWSGFQCGTLVGAKYTLDTASLQRRAVAEMIGLEPTAGLPSSSSRPQTGGRCSAYTAFRQARSKAGYKRRPAPDSGTSSRWVW
jgi:hypothetical protein